MEVDSITVEAIRNVQLINGTSDDLSDFRPLAALYVQCIDKEGFVFDFDLVWRLCGYSTKSNAKRVLLRHPFVQGQHYSVNRSSGLMSAFEAGQTHVQNGGQNHEHICLTANGLGQFALAAQTERGRMLRDFVMQLTLGFKRFTEAVAAGEIEIRRAAPVTENPRDSKRLKVCESQKHLMATVHERPGMNAGDYARINGVTNKAVTGRYKHELAKELGRAPSSVNARDYMCPVQLAGATFLEFLSAKRMHENMDISALDVHTNTARQLEPMFRELHTSAIPEQRSLRDVRRQAAQALTDREDEAAAIAAAPAIAEAVVAAVVPEARDVRLSITHYFARRN